MELFDAADVILVATLVNNMHMIEAVEERTVGSAEQGLHRGVGERLPSAADEERHWGTPLSGETAWIVREVIRCFSLSAAIHLSAAVGTLSAYIAGFRRFCRKFRESGCHFCIGDIRASARSMPQKLLHRYAQGKCAKVASNHTLRFGCVLKKLASALYSERNALP